MTSPAPRHTVFVGRRPLEGLLSRTGLQHWGIKVGPYWYEIRTKTVASTEFENVIVVARLPQASFPVVHRIGTTNATPHDMDLIMQQWLFANKYYRITDQNCQYWVHDVLRRLGFSEIASSRLLPQFAWLFGRSKAS